VEAQLTSGTFGDSDVCLGAAQTPRRGIAESDQPSGLHLDRGKFFSRRLRAPLHVQRWQQLSWMISIAN
jgi:hypothetical protein